MRNFIFAALGFIFIALQTQPSFAMWGSQSFSAGVLFWAEGYNLQFLQNSAEYNCATGRAKRVGRIHVSDNEALRVYSAKFVCLKGPIRYIPSIDFDRVKK